MRPRDSYEQEIRAWAQVVMDFPKPVRVEVDATREVSTQIRRVRQVACMLLDGRLPVPTDFPVTELGKLRHRVQVVEDRGELWIVPRKMKGPEWLPEKLLPSAQVDWTIDRACEKTWQALLWLAHNRLLPCPVMIRKSVQTVPPPDPGEMDVAVVEDPNGWVIL